jgi:hypothetical protein
MMFSCSNFRSADSVLEDISKFAFVDTEASGKSIFERQQVDVSFCQTVHKKMSGELKAWLAFIQALRLSCRLVCKLPSFCSARVNVIHLTSGQLM